MLTVKVRKEELECGEIPTLCMVCGEKDAETRIPYVARILFFPLGLLGIAGKYLTPKRYEMSVLCCNGCKSGFIYEQNMSNIWLTLRLCAAMSLLFVLVADIDGAPANLLIPVIIVISTLILESLYFWTLGKKNAIRVVGMDSSSVSFDFPNPGWSGAYTKLRRDAEAARHRRF